MASLWLGAMLLGSSCVVDGDVDCTVFVVIDEDDDDEVETEVEEDDADVDGNDVEGCLCIFLLCRPTASALNPFEAAVVGRDGFCRPCAIDDDRKGGRLLSAAATVGIVLGLLCAGLLKSLECVGTEGFREGIGVVGFFSRREVANGDVDDGGNAGVADDKEEVEPEVALSGCCGSRCVLMSRLHTLTGLLVFSLSLLFSMLSSSVIPPSRMVTFRTFVGALFAAGAIFCLEPSSSSSSDEAPNDLNSLSRKLFSPADVPLSAGDPPITSVSGCGGEGGDQGRGGGRSRGEGIGGGHGDGRGGG
jgi:hypothetical protein